MKISFSVVKLKDLVKFVKITSLLLIFLVLFFPLKSKAQEQASQSAKQATESAVIATPTPSPNPAPTPSSTLTPSPTSTSVSNPSPPPNAKFIPPATSKLASVVDYTKDGWPIVADELIVKFKDNVSDNDKDNTLGGKGAQTKKISKFNGVRLIKVNPQEREKIRQELASNPNVEYVQVNAVTQPAQASRLEPNDFNPNDQWHLQKIQAPEGWYITQGSSSKTIAILDTGVNYNHPDLKDKVIKNYDFVNDDWDPMDDNWHGTAAAGVAAATTNNGIGIAAVGWQPKIMAIKVADASDVSTTFNMAQGIFQATAYGADVISISQLVAYNNDPDGPYLYQAVTNAVNQGKIIVAAAGNCGRDSNVGQAFPSAFSEVIAVAATDSSDRFVWGCHGHPITNPTGSKKDPDIAAPGLDLPTTNIDGGYGLFSGTSAATPVTAGVVAMMLSCNSDANTVKNTLYSTADDVEDPGRDSLTGWGRVNLYKALSAVCGPNPVVSVTASPNPTSGSPVTVQVKATDPNSDLTLLQYYNEVTGRWSHAIPQLNQNCNSSVCSITETISSFPETNRKYRLTAAAYDQAGNMSVFCAYGCPDNDTTLGSNNFLELLVGSGLTVAGLPDSAESSPAYLKNLTTSSGSVIVNLNWTDTAGENGFSIQKGIGSYPTFAEITTVPADNTSYQETLPASQEGSVLTYRIVAKFPDNSSSLSNQQTITAPVVTPSSFPIEANTACSNNKVQVSLSWGALAQGTNYKIYQNYKNNNDNLVTILYAPDAYPGYLLSYTWQPGMENLAAGDLVVHVVGQTPGGSIDSSHISVPATNCQPQPSPPPPIDPPGSGILTATTVCSTWHPWANADWNPRRGYTGEYKAQYKLTSQSSWTDSLEGNTSETWDSIWLDYGNGTYNIRVITTQDNQIWANPITINVYCEQPTGEVQVSYRCGGGTPVADLSWPPAPTYNGADKISNYEIRYLRPGQTDWSFGIQPSTNDTFLSTEDFWYGGPLVSGEIWGWKILAKYHDYVQWAGPIYAGPIPYCPPNGPQSSASRKNPTIVINDTSGPSGASRSWSNPNGARSSDDSRAWTTLNAETGSTSYYLKATGFSYAIPSDAVINGFRVLIERRRDKATAVDASLKLVKNGSVVGQEKADWNTNWPEYETYRAYGGSNDLWGTSWTPADINNSNFGVAFAANAGSPPEGDEYVFVDHISIIVYYTIPLSYPCPCDSFGDINSDGKITQGDIDLISQYIAGQTSFTDEQKRRADVNGDGQINQADIDKVTAYMDSALPTFPVCEDSDNDGLPNYKDTDDDGNGAIDPPTISITVNPSTITAEEPFTITVTGTSPIGLDFIWWFGDQTGVTDATVTITYPPEPASDSRVCTDPINPTKLDRAFCSPQFGAPPQAVTYYSFTSTVIINQPGTYRFGANARDVLYWSDLGKPHQASEGFGIQVADVQNLPPSLGDIGSQSVIEGQSLNITVSATDPDNDPLTYSVADLPQGASFNEKTLAWTPGYQQNGTYEVTFTASDGKLTDSKTSTITVLNDGDMDGFADSVELYIGTDPFDACPDNSLDAAWPPDFNNNRIVNISDVAKYKSKLYPAPYDKRYDLNTDGVVNISDVLSLKQYIGKKCTNPLKK